MGVFLSRGIPIPIPGYSLLPHFLHLYLTYRLQSWTRVFGQICICGFFFNTHMSNLSSQPHRQRWTLVSRIFPEFQHCIRVGNGELQAIFKKDALFYEGTQKLQKIINTALLSQGLLSRIVVSTS